MSHFNKPENALRRAHGVCRICNACNASPVDGLRRLRAWLLTLVVVVAQS